jgi:hypothetical protein
MAPVAKSVRTIMGLLLLTGKPRVLLPRSLWPLHDGVRDVALCLAFEEPTRQAQPLVLISDGNVGMAVVGLSAALLELCESGALTFVECGVDSHYRVNHHALAPFVQELMTLPPAVAEQVYQLGKRLNTSSDRVLKNWVKLRAGSTGSSPWSGNTGSLLHGPVGVSC